MRNGIWTVVLVAVAGVGLTAVPGALATPAQDYVAVRGDWQPDQVLTPCRFTLAELLGARSQLTPEDSYTDLPSAISAEIARRRAGRCARPVVSAMRFTPSTFRVSARATAITAAHAGSVLRFSLSRAATVKIVVQRRKKVGRVFRWVRAGTLTRRRGRAGANKVAFSGRIGRRALASGRYRATLTATGLNRRVSQAKRRSFLVVP
jgi:Zn-dependent alcohol dehydrogenase